MTGFLRPLVSALVVLGLTSPAAAQDPPTVLFLNKHGKYPVRFVARVPKSVFGWGWSEAGVSIETYPGGRAQALPSADVLKIDGQILTLTLAPPNFPEIAVGTGNELWFVTDSKDIERGRSWARFLDATEAAYRQRAELPERATVGQLGNCSVVSLPAEPEPRWPADWTLEKATPNATGPDSYEPDSSSASQSASKSVKVRRFLRWVESREPSTPCTGTLDLQLFPIEQIAGDQEGHFLTLQGARVPQVSFAALSPDSWEPGTRLRGKPPIVDSRIEVELEQPAGSLDPCSVPSLEGFCAAEKELRRRMYVRKGDSDSLWGETIGPYARFYRGPVQLSEDPPIESIASDDGKIQWTVPWNGNSVEAILQLPGIEGGTSISLRAQRPRRNDSIVGLILSTIVFSSLLAYSFLIARVNLRVRQEEEPLKGREQDPTGVGSGGTAPGPKGDPPQELQARPGESLPPPPPSSTGIDRGQVESLLLSLTRDPASVLGSLSKKLEELPDFVQIRRDFEDLAENSKQTIEEQLKAALEDLKNAQQSAISSSSQELSTAALRAQKALEKKGGEIEQRLQTIDESLRDELVRFSAPKLEELADALMNDRLQKEQKVLKDHAQTVVEQEVREKWVPYSEFLQAIEPLLRVPGRLEALRGLFQLIEQNPAIASRLQELSETLPAEGALFAFAPDHTALQAISKEEGHRYAADRYKALVAEILSLDGAERDRVYRGLEAAGMLGSWSQGLLQAIEAAFGEASTLRKHLPSEAFAEWLGAVQALYDFALRGGPVFRNLARMVRHGEVETCVEDGRPLRYAEGLFLEHSGLLKNERSSGAPLFKRLRSCLFPYNQVGRLSRVCLAAQFLVEAFPREQQEEAERKGFQPTLRNYLRERDLPEDFHSLFGDAAAGCSLTYRPVPYYQARINQPGYEFIERSVSAIRLEQRIGRLPEGVDSWLVVRLRSPFLFEDGGVIYSGHAHVAHVRRQGDA
jgi:hypothetical protein